MRTGLFKVVAAIHDRMPVILQPEDYQTLAIAGSGSARADEAVPIRADDHVANRQEGRIFEERYAGHHRRD